MVPCRTVGHRRECSCIGQVCRGREVGVARQGAHSPGSGGHGDAGRSISLPVIARRLVEVGQVVAAGQTMFTLAADGEREVLISLPEQNFGRFKTGQAVTVELWTQPGQRFPGRIRELSPSADPRSRTFATRIAFAEGKVPAELGQSARVFIQTEHTVALSVPLSALTAENGVNYVWRVDADSTLKRVPVRIAAYGQDSVPVLEGLKATDWVVAAGVHVLHEGEQIRPVDRSNREVKLAAKE